MGRKSERATPKPSLEPEITDDEDEEVPSPKGVSPKKRKSTRRARSESQSSESLVETPAKKKKDSPKKDKKSKSEDSEEEEDRSDEEVETPSKRKIDSPTKKAKKSKVEESEAEEEDVSDEEDNKKTKKANGSAKQKKQASEDEEEDDNEEFDYEVEKIVGHRQKGGKTLFKVRWKGYNPHHDSWEYESNINCNDLVKEYWNEKKSSKKKPATPQDGEWEILRIIDMHTLKTGKREFLVRWKGFTPDDDTWEPEQNLKHTDLLEKFFEKLDRIKQVSYRELRVSRAKTDRLTYMPQGDHRRESKRYRNKNRIRYFED